MTVERRGERDGVGERGEVITSCKVVTENTAATINQLWAIETNWCHIIRNVHYGRLTPNGIKAAFSPFFVLSARKLHYVQFVVSY